MMKKQMIWKTKGMNRDLSVSAFNPEFAFENINLRLSTNEGNTLMSWVNEKGTEKINLTSPLEGVPIGTAIINHKLIVFTTKNTMQEGYVPTGDTDHIYVIKREEEEFQIILTIKRNLLFDTDHPLETLVSYEADNIEKVYWTDNKNQPRVINIIRLIEQAEDGILEAETDDVETKFDFVTSAKLDSTLSVTKRTSGGMFAPGVIQYCYTYFNKYGQQSNIVNVSPLYYLTHSSRGASAEDKVSNSFEIVIEDLDENFDMVRLYSIHRSSLNGVPTILALEDFTVSDNGVHYIDTGSSGDSVDPTELLFVGGTEITALTMEAKDQTLFLGNITQKNSDVSEIQKYVEEHKDEIDIDFHNEVISYNSYDLEDPTDALYSNTFTLDNNRRKISSFKGGDYYRLGFQLQKYTGEWTEPIFIKDVQNLLYPKTSVFDETVQLPYAKATLDLIDVTESPEEFLKTYKRIRPLVVYPEIQDRFTVCQGILNPTVFNVEDRKEGQPFSQASWYFRPYTVNKKIEKELDDNVHFQKDGTVTIDEDPNGYTIMLLRIKASELGYYLENRMIDFEAGGGLIKDEKYPYYAVLKLGTVWVKDNEDDDEDTEFCDMLFWIPVPPGMSEEYYFQSIRASMEVGHPKEAPNWEATRVVAWSGYNSDNVVKYAFPSNFEPDSFCGFLKYVGNNDCGSTEVNFRKSDFRLYKNYPHVEDNYIGSYTITLYKDTLESRTPFVHYESLFTESDHEKDMIVEEKDSEGITTTRDYYSETGRKIKQVEIQSSVKKYSTPFSTTPEKDTENTNNQFFVDQSIITLNSADLDFDTTVQEFIPESLKLRIVGIVPITANSSAHKITYTNSMLPLDYQTEEDDEGNIKESTTFGKGELDLNVYITNKNLNAGERLIAENLWEDSWLYVSGGKVHSTYPDAAHYLVYPWHSTRSLTNDPRGNDTAASVLKTKVESHLLYSYNTAYFSNYPISIQREGKSPELEQTEYSYDEVNVQLHLQENEFIENLQLPKQLAGGNINYYPNIEKSLVNDKEWRTYAKNYRSLKNKSNPVLMKYKSSTHAVISLPGENNKIPILPYTYNYAGYTIGEYTGAETGTTFWGDTISGFNQDGLDVSNAIKKEGETYTAYDFMWLAELYKTPDPDSLFGGKDRKAIMANKWVVGGDAKPLELLEDENDNSQIKVELLWTEGDTFYQRYDCLKTYSYSPDDTNQMVEILSFMCESHVNLDGRYDRNRGMRDNTNVSPINFNLMNPAYDQQDNFFNYKKTDEDKVSKYPNMITFTKTKESGADVDQWTNITLSSNLELDGNKGEISSLQRFNDQLIAFQDTGISQILYNENVQISSTQGVPIEIANSGKVQGKRYLNNTIGCSNKWSIANSPSGIYFIDSNDKGIYLFNGELTNLSSKFGFNVWCKKNIFSEKNWTPTSFEDFVTYYDKQNQEVLFINKDRALAFSEKIGAFTSFYDYGNVPYFCNFDDIGVWLNKDNSELESSSYYLWKHNGGNYCNFFGVDKPYSMTLVGNPEPQIDKTFTNLEFRANIDGDGEYDSDKDKFTPALPFNSIETWNEYQHGLTPLTNKNGRAAMIHYSPDNTSSLKRKFRIWRCDIPRDTYAAPESNTEKGITRYKAHPMDRMRNPWIYIKLSKEATKNVMARTELHDICMTYFD